MNRIRSPSPSNVTRLYRRGFFRDFLRGCGIHHIKWFTLLLIAFISCVVPNVAAADKTGNDREAELENLRERIKDVETGLDKARDRSDRLQNELRDNEIAAGELALRIKELDEAIANKLDRIDEINHVIAKHENSLSAERQQLARQIRSAYMAGRSDYIKLLLNQEDPARVGRVLAYHDYYNRARTETIRTISDKVNLVNELKNTLQKELAALETLKERQLERSINLAESREYRESILAELQEYITTQGDELKVLRENEQQLSQLLNELDQREDSILFFEDIPPFDTLKGALVWPVEGKLLNSFGSSRGKNLEWKGVRIGTDIGREVRAVHTGKVVFAGWFRNLGLLIILDHGDEYMSLYGYNQTLLKKPGDWVLAGETIALSGDSGGQHTAGVYFEIRHQGKPLNPAIWCRR